jgi:quercetin 2,3-dioxygenase
VVDGELSVCGETLAQGDRVGITDASDLDITFHADSKGLLFDLRMDAPMVWR